MPTRKIPAGFERAGVLGVGVLPVMFGWEPLPGLLGAYRAAATNAGHDPATLPLVLLVNGVVTEKSVDDAGPLTGSPEQIAAQLPRAAELGIDHIVWNMIGTPPDAQLSAMRAFMQAM